MTNITRVCYSCKLPKPIGDFSRNRKSRGGYKGECKKCLNKRRQQRRANNTNEVRKKLAKRYNLSHEEYMQLHQLQGGKCRICGKPEVNLGRLLSVDHNHKTGKVRGLLCFKCNTAIGLLLDSKSLLEKALRYLSDHGGED
jgi:hypothetical protein